MITSRTCRKTGGTAVSDKVMHPKTRVQVWHAEQLCTWLGLCEANSWRLSTWRRSRARPGSGTATLAALVKRAATGVPCTAATSRWPLSVIERRLLVPALCICAMQYAHRLQPCHHQMLPPGHTSLLLSPLVRCSASRADSIAAGTDAQKKSVLPHSSHVQLLTVCVRALSK
jgi:hypothetical protein